MPPDNSTNDPRLPGLNPQTPPTNTQAQPLTDQPATNQSTTPQPAPLSDQPQQPPDITIPKSTRKIYFAVISFFIFIIVAILGSGIALAYNDYKLLAPPEPIKKAIDNLIILSPFPKPDRIILESTIAKSANLKSADQKLEVSMSTTSKTSPVSSFKLTVDGPVEFDKPNSNAAEADIGLEVKFEGASFNGSASVKTVNDTLYFKINEFPFGSIYQQFLSYKDKWFFYKVPEDYLPKDENLAQNIKFQQILEEFITDSKDWTKVTKNNDETYALDVTPTKEKIDKLVFDIIQTYETQNKEESKIINDLKIEQVAEITEKIRNLKIVAVVHSNTYYLKRADITFDIAVENFGQIPTGQTTLPAGEETVYNFRIATELSNYNRQVVVIPPDGAQDIAPEIEKIFGLTMSGQTDTNQDKKIKSDIAQIATELQSYSALSSTQGTLTYPKSLEDLVTQEFINELPAPPTESGITNYAYSKFPQDCLGTKESPCLSVTVYAPLITPSTSENVWCWSSGSGAAKETTLAACTPTSISSSPQEEAQELDNLNLEILELNENVLGKKHSWDLELIQLFTKFLN